MSTIQTVGVVGAGTMGNGITQAFAASGINVVMTDIADAALQKALATISGSYDRLIKKEKASTEQKAAALQKITISTDLAAIAQCDMVIEAATENEALKLKIFKQLDDLAKPEAILASNTSSISITKLAAATQRPDKVIGLHFFNPVPMMALVELIHGLQTSAETQSATEAVARQIGKAPVKVRNAPGFVVNRLLCPMINEAIFALGEGLASAAEIDDAIGVEIDVGQRREEGLRHVGIDFGIDDADLARGDGVGRNGLQQVYQHVLQVGDFTGLAAHAARKAAAGVALGGTDGVFTLHAKHGGFLVGWDGKRET